MSNKDEMKEVEEQDKRRESEVIAKYGADITKLRKRSYCKRSKKNKR